MAFPTLPLTVEPHHIKSHNLQPINHWMHICRACFEKRHSSHSLMQPRQRCLSVLWFLLNWLPGTDSGNTDGHFCHQRAETSTDPAKHQRANIWTIALFRGPQDDGTFAWQNHIYLYFCRSVEMVRFLSHGEITCRPLVLDCNNAKNLKKAPRVFLH